MNWKPIRRGPIYCSPACGAGCTHHDYERAKKAAEACLARMKTTGWKIRLNENMGWYWSLVKEVPGGAVITVRGGQIPYREKPDRGFHSMLSARGHAGSCDANWHDNADFDDPNDAVAHRIKLARKFIDPILEMMKHLE